MDAIIDLLKAAGEPTRLRILALLREGELSAGELSTVLGQSQPRVSRHLKLLSEAGLLERRPEGSWVFFRLSDEGPGARILSAVLAETAAGGFMLTRDRERLAQVRAQREQLAQAYFEAAAGEWEALRRLHQPEAAVETALAEAVGEGPFDLHLDLGSGTGRVLQLLGSRVRRGEGIDSSRKMLALARAKLDGEGHSGLSVRQGDILALPFADAAADLVTVHQVLHYLADPALAVAEAARVLRPGGRLVIVDFAPHTYEELREKHAHRRLGFPVNEIRRWLESSGLALQATRTIHPEDGQPGLAVTLWVAGSPATSQTSRSAA